MLHSVSPSLSDDVLLDLKVAIDEVGPILQIGHDATHMGCGKDNSVGALGIKKLSHGHTIEQVERGVGFPHEVAVAAGLEVVPDSRTHQAAMTGDVDFCVFL